MEGAAHHLGAGEPAALGDALERAAVGLEHAAGALDAQLLNVVGGGGAELAAEDATELSFGEMEPGRKGSDGEVRGEVIRNP